MDAALAPLRFQCIRVLNYLDDWLIQWPTPGVSESSQRYRSLPHSFSWPQNDARRVFSSPLSEPCFFRGSLGFRSDAGQFGSFPDIQFYSMSGLLQARPSCLSKYLPQAARPHGSGLSCVAPRVSSHEAVPLWVKELRLHPTIPATRLIMVCVQLLSTLFTMAGPPLFSWVGSEWVRFTVAIWSRRTHQWWAGAQSSKADRCAGNGQESSFLHINCLNSGLSSWLWCIFSLFLGSII